MAPTCRAERTKLMVAAPGQGQSRRGQAAAAWKMLAKLNSHSVHQVGFADAATKLYSVGQLVAPPVIAQSHRGDGVERPVGGA